MQKQKSNEQRDYKLLLLTLLYPDQASSALVFYTPVGIKVRIFILSEG